MSAFATTSLRPMLRAAPRTAISARPFSASSSNSMARMNIVGALGAEPELKPTASGTDMIRYSVASSHGPTNNRQTSWFKITSFFTEGPQRDYMLSLPKGTIVAVGADAHWASLTDAEGKTSTVLSLRQNYFEVLRRGTPRESADYSNNAPSE
ncbi:hypothetical protein BJX99DRAFT_241730 [Aspergillus californicus]